MQIRHLRAADYRRMRWKNGGGWTTELAVSPNIPDSADFDWRISIAEIESDGAFSTFPQCDRLIALLDGHGMRLDFDAAPSVLLDQRLRFTAFSGDWKTAGTLLDGPVRDFNIIARREAFQIEALHRPLVGSMVFLDAANVTWFVHVLAGHAQIQYDEIVMELAANDSAILQSSRSKGRAVLDGGGELVLVKLTTRTTDTLTLE